MIEEVLKELEATAKSIRDHQASRIQQVPKLKELYEAHVSASLKAKEVEEAFKEAALNDHQFADADRIWEGVDDLLRGLKARKESRKKAKGIA